MASRATMANVCSGTTHKQVTVRLRGLEAKVDEGIAGLIRETWRAGFRTEFSCEGSSTQRAYILFTHATEAESWLRIVNPAPVVTQPHKLSEQQLRRWQLRTGTNPGRSARDEWSFHLRVQDFDAWPALAVHFSVSIHFPKKDIADVTDLLKAHNRSAKRITLPDSARA